MRCKECLTSKLDKLYEDPRTPPLDDGEIICKDCTKMALEDVIHELLEQVAEYQHRLNRL